MTGGVPHIHLPQPGGLVRGGFVVTTGGLVVTTGGLVVSPVGLIDVGCLIVVEGLTDVGGEVILVVEDGVRR